MADSTAVVAGTDATAAQYNNIRKDALGSKKGHVVLTDSATITLDLSESSSFEVTMGGNRTFAVSNPSVGQIFTLRQKQDATGSRIPTWWSNISWPFNVVPTNTTTPAKADRFVFVCREFTAGQYYYDGYAVGLNT